MTRLSKILARISENALRLHPDDFTARVAYYRSGGFNSGSDEAIVATSYSHPLPVAEDGGMKDRIDRRLQEDRRVYLANLADADRLLAACVGLEARWLVPIVVPDKDMLRELDALTSDASSCLCGNTRELWKRAGWKSTWRIKRGFGPCCYSTWTNDGRPDATAWIAARRREEASA